MVLHDGPIFPVNSVCWAPHEFGLILACGSSDGSISVVSSTGDGNWDSKKIPNAHTVGKKLSNCLFMHLQYRTK